MDDKEQAAIDALRAAGLEDEAQAVESLRARSKATIDNMHAAQRASYKSGQDSVRPQPLTDSQIESIIKANFGRGIDDLEYARLIEHEHGIGLSTWRPGLLCHEARQSEKTKAVKSESALSCAARRALDYLDSPPGKLFPVDTLHQITSEICAALAAPAPKPMTDEEIDALALQMAKGRQSIHWYTRVIESVHGIFSHPDASWKEDMKAKADATFNRDWDTPLRPST